MHRIQRICCQHPGARQNRTPKEAPPWIGLGSCLLSHGHRTSGLSASRIDAQSYWEVLCYKLFGTFIWPFLNSFCSMAWCIVLLWRRTRSATVFGWVLHFRLPPHECQECQQNNAFDVVTDQFLSLIFLSQQISVTIADEVNCVANIKDK